MFAHPQHDYTRLLLAWSPASAAALIEQRRPLSRLRERGPADDHRQRAQRGRSAGRLSRFCAAGGTALDAVEAALRACEDNLTDHYVGTGGLPNARGEVELDASVMVGSTRAFGAVAAVKGYPHPISVARAVLERLPQHACWSARGASCSPPSAASTRRISSPRSRAGCVAALRRRTEAVEGEKTAHQPGDEAYRLAALDLVRRLAPHDGPWGTINVIALDASGELVVGVSTSGYPFKYPGRVGDSAVAGAGNYCDLRYGGAACTGRGELSMRAGTAPARRRAAAPRGRPVEAACRDARRRGDPARRVPRRTARARADPGRPARRRRPARPARPTR